MMKTNLETIQKQINLANLESSLEDLFSESNEIFKLLDTVSSAIRKLESSLQDSKTHFLFKFQIKKETSKAIWNLKNYHKDIALDAEGYVITTSWYLLWDAEENSKNYRLFLVGEEAEVLFHGFEECYREYELPPIYIFKKPFIETDLHKRLKYSEYLILFINSFKEYLNKYRVSIEKDMISSNQI